MFVTEGNDSVMKRCYCAPGVACRIFETWIQAPDGTDIYTFGMLPETGKCPLVLSRNPYVEERRIDTEKFVASTGHWIEAGYGVVVQHCRGCGMSEGEWVPYHSERDDGLAFLRWIREQPFYNGVLFVEGGSYLASVHFCYLNTCQPDIRGACLDVQDCNRYNILYRNGFFKPALHGNWFIDGYRKKNKRMQRNKDARWTDFPLVEFPLRYFGMHVPELESDIAHPDGDDPYWKDDFLGGGYTLDALTRSRVPTLLRTNWHDIYTGGIFEMWKSLSDEHRAACAMVVGAYQHGDYAADNPGTPVQFPDGAKDALVTAREWFDHIRKGTPLARAKKGEVTYYNLWENKWHSGKHLTNGETELRFTLSATDGATLRLLAGDDAADAGIHRGVGTPAVGVADARCVTPVAGTPDGITYAYDPRNPATFKGTGCLNFGGMQEQEPPDFRDDVKSFLTAPFERAVDLKGSPELHLVCKSDCEDTCFYVRICIEKANGKTYPVRDDITSLNYHQPVDYVPNTERELVFHFSEYAMRIEKGDKIRLDVTSSNTQFALHSNIKGKQFLQRETKVARNAIVLGKSYLSLFAAHSIVM
jgi:predicted acyl esterase